MQDQKKESMPRIIERKYEGDQKLETLLFLWMKKELDGKK
jgi:hypothetical protein